MVTIKGETFFGKETERCMSVWIFKTIADHGGPWEIILLILKKVEFTLL